MRVEAALGGDLFIRDATVPGEPLDGGRLAPVVELMREVVEVMEELRELVNGDHGLEEAMELREGLRIVCVGGGEYTLPGFEIDGRDGTGLAVMYPSSSNFVELFHLIGIALILDALAAAACTRAAVGDSGVKL